MAESRTLSIAEQVRFDSLTARIRALDGAIAEREFEVEVPDTEEEEEAAEAAGHPGHLDPHVGHIPD